MKLTASKWEVAALTLVTLPATIWFVEDNPDSFISKFMPPLGFLPLYIGAAMELHSQWAAVLEKWRNPEVRAKDVPAGNEAFFILGLTLAGLVLFLACIGAVHRT